MNINNLDDSLFERKHVFIRRVHGWEKFSNIFLYKTGPTLWVFSSRQMSVKRHVREKKLAQGKYQDYLSN